MESAIKEPVLGKLASPSRGAYTHRIHSSIGEVSPEEWRRASGGNTGLFMDIRFIAAVERSLGAHARFWHVLFYDELGIPMACASFCLYRVDISLLAGKPLKAIVGWLRRFFPSFAYVYVLFCGLPVSVGQKSVAFAEACDRARVVEMLDNIMKDLAIRERVRILVFKEFNPDECLLIDRLLSRGYRRAESPHMHLLEPRFRNFEEYSDALKSHYRYDIKRSMRKFAATGFWFSRVRDGEHIARVYTDEVHRLYEAVVARAENKLELLPAKFFRELGLRFSGAVSLTLVNDGDQVVAFNYSLSTDGCYCFLFCGMDYRVNAQSDLYFNLMYQDLDQGFREGVRVLQLGQASERFKARLGSDAVPLFFYVKADGMVGALFRWGGRWLFPPRPPAVKFDIFKAR